MTTIDSATIKSSFTNFSPREIGTQLWSAGHALFKPTLDSLRIDKPIKKFYETRDTKDARAVVQDVAMLALQGYICACGGFKTMVPTCVAMNFAFEYFARTYRQGSAPFDWKAAFPSSTAIQHIGLGLVSGLALSYLNKALGLLLMKMMQSMGFTLKAEQAAIVAAKSFGIFGKLFSLIGCTLLPTLEEAVFRGTIMSSMLESRKPEKTLTLGNVHINLSKTETLIKTSLIFGLFHASFSQGWTNLPLIAGTSLMGMFFGSLRLITGNLWAPTVAHMLNNALAFSRVHGIHLPSLTTRFVEVLKDKRSLGLLILA